MKTLKNRLKSELKNFYLMQGDDYYLYDRAFLMIKKRAEITIEDFNLSVFDDDNFNIDTFLNSAESLPMGDDKKIILLKNISKITENDKKTLENYLKSPSDSTILVVFDYFEKFSNLKAYGEFVDCKRFDRALATNFIVSEFEKRGKKISGEACETLLDCCNGYLTRVVNEIDKLAYYDPYEPMITKKLVESMVNKDTEYVIYELTEALGQKNGDKAIKILDQIGKEQGILGLITNHFRRLFFISTSELDDKTLANLLNVKEYAIKKQREQTKNFSKIQLKRIFEMLEDVDFKIKSGAMLSENALYFLVLSILYI